MKILRFRRAQRGRLHVVQRAALPAREISPARRDVVARSVIEASVKKLTPTTAGLARVAALFAAFSALFIIRLFAFFFVRHNSTLSCCSLFFTATSLDLAATSLLVFRGATSLGCADRDVLRVILKFRAGFTVFVVPDACRLKDVHAAFSFLQENPSRNASSFGFIAGILPVSPAAESHSAPSFGCMNWKTCGFCRLMRWICRQFCRPASFLVFLLGSNRRMINSVTATPSQPETAATIGMQALFATIAIAGSPWRFILIRDSDSTPAPHIRRSVSFKALRFNLSNREQTSAQYPEEERRTSVVRTRRLPARLARSSAC